MQDVPNVVEAYFPRASTAKLMTSNPDAFCLLLRLSLSLGHPFHFALLFRFCSIRRRKSDIRTDRVRRDGYVHESSGGEHHTVDRRICHDLPGQLWQLLPEQLVRGNRPVGGPVPATPTGVDNQAPAPRVQPGWSLGPRSDSLPGAAIFVFSLFLFSILHILRGLKIAQNRCISRPRGRLGFCPSSCSQLPYEMYWRR